VAGTRRIVGGSLGSSLFFSPSLPLSLPPPLPARREARGGDDHVASVTHLERSLFPPPASVGLRGINIDDGKVKKRNGRGEMNRAGLVLEMRNGR